MGQDGELQQQRRRRGDRDGLGQQRTRRTVAAQRPLGSRRHPQSDAQESDWQPTSSETLVHFHKSFGVMQEIFDHRDFVTLREDLLNCAALAGPPGALPQPRFLDLGCAPGGFSACLLQDHVLGPASTGYGVSLPPELGGFNLAFFSHRLAVQLEDILQLQSPDLLAIDNSIDLVIGDAQYLSNIFKQKSSQIKYRGMTVKSRSLGIWALTVKECQLAFAKLRHGGSFVFRFGWRGVGSGSSDVHPSGEQVHPSLLAKYLEEEEWYKALTHWLFSVLKSLFSALKPFKSEYVHQADVSFYMVCRTFDREKYVLHNWEAKLQRAFDELATCEDVAALVAGIKDGITDETKAEINELLEIVGRMRAIGINSRKVTNPTAFTAKYGVETQKKEVQAEAKAEDVEEVEEETKLEAKSEDTATATTAGGTEEGAASQASQASTTPPSDTSGGANGPPLVEAPKKARSADTVASVATSAASSAAAASATTAAAAPEQGDTRTLDSRGAAKAAGLRVAGRGGSRGGGRTGGRIAGRALADMVPPPSTRQLDGPAITRWRSLNRGANSGGGLADAWGGGGCGGDSSVASNAPWGQVMGYESLEAERVFYPPEVQYQRETQEHQRIAVEEGQRAFQMQAYQQQQQFWHPEQHQPHLLMQQQQQLLLDEMIAPLPLLEEERLLHRHNQPQAAAMHYLGDPPLEGQQVPSVWPSPSPPSPSRPSPQLLPPQVPAAITAAAAARLRTLPLRVKYDIGAPRRRAAERSPTGLTRMPPPRTATKASTPGTGSVQVALCANSVRATSTGSGPARVVIGTAVPVASGVARRISSTSMAR